MTYGLKFKTAPFKTSQTEAVHRHRMMESLGNRLTVARSAQNTQLIEILEQERHQLEANARDLEVLQRVELWFKAIYKSVSRFFRESPTLKISEFHCGSDRWLYIFDPITQEFRYADSEVELEELMQTIHQR